MLLTGITLAGWRSFSPQHPAVARNLGMVNLLIGPNNVGKSNLGRFLVRVRDILIGLGHQSTDPWKNPGAFYSPLNIQFPTQEIDHWMREGEIIRAEIWLQETMLESEVKLPDNVVSPVGVKFEITIEKRKSIGHLAIIPISVKGQHVILVDGNNFKLLLADGSYTEQVTNVHLHRGLALAACKCLASAIIEIRALRDPSRKSEKQNFRTTDGGDIITSLEHRGKNKNEQFAWGELKADLELWFCKLLGEKTIRIEINDGEFWITINRGNRELRCELSDMGAGVSEILIMLAYLRMHCDQDFLVIIDEPEAHLHPGAVVELISIVTSHLPKHQLLITTHSTSLIDSLTPDWRTFRVRRATHHGTAIEEIDNAERQLALLADLGIRPSQLFLARVALWVEGPSDVYYWTALIREIDPTLVLNRDFTFITYGGSSSSHLDFTSAIDDDNHDITTEKLVNILKVSHRAVIICDRDRNFGEKDRPLVARLIAAAEKLPQHARVQLSHGREIENGVKEPIIVEILDKIRPKRFNKPEKMNISYAAYSIGVDDSFDEIVSKAARTENGDALSEPEIARIKQALEQKKSEIGQLVYASGSTQKIFRDETVASGEALIKWFMTDPTPFIEENGKAN
jgi:predicted ATPase